jgi:AcrR family transcriptional regulator
MTVKMPASWKAKSDEAKRTLILDAALQVFGKRGFVTPTMDDVASEAGYAKRSLYRFYQSKDEIGAALALRSCKALVLGMEPIENKSLFDIAWAYYRLSHEDPLVFRVILDTREWLASDTPLPQKEDLAAVDAALLAILKSRVGPPGGERLIVAFGYVEFLFRYKSFRPLAGHLGGEKAVRATLEKLLNEEKS